MNPATREIDNLIGLHSGRVLTRGRKVQDAIVLEAHVGQEAGSDERQLERVLPHVVQLDGALVYRVRIGLGREPEHKQLQRVLFDHALVWLDLPGLVAQVLEVVGERVIAGRVPERQGSIDGLVAYAHRKDDVLRVERVARQVERLARGMERVAETRHGQVARRHGETLVYERVVAQRLVHGVAL